MYKININKIREIIVNLVKKPDSINEYSTYVLCAFGDDRELEFKIDDNSCIIFTRKKDYVDKEIIKPNDLDYMNSIIEEFVSRR